MSEKLYNDSYLLQLQNLLSKTVDRSIEVLAPKSGVTITDIGCGTGNLAVKLAQYGATVYGIDNDHHFLETARCNNYTPNPVQFIHASADQTSIPDDSIDKVVFHRALQHIPDHLSVFEECSRILKGNGIIHLVEPDYLSLTFFLPDNMFERKLADSIAKNRIPNSYQIRQIPKTLQSAGFSIEQTEIYNYVFKSLDLANYLINFDDEIQKGTASKYFTQNEFESWQALKRLPEEQVVFSINMILITAKKEQ